MNPWNIRYWLDIELPQMIRNNQVVSPEIMVAILQSVQNTIDAAVKSHPTTNQNERGEAE